MTDPNRFTMAQASDPETPDWLLADIAALRPDLQAVVARNPNASERLLVWLGELGDPKVDAALAARTGGSRTAPRRPPAASRPTVAQPSVSVPFGVFWAPSQPTGPQPTGLQPTGLRSTRPQPAGPRPTGTQPTGPRPTVAQPGVAASSAYRPTASWQTTPQWAGRQPSVPAAGPSMPTYSAGGPVPAPGGVQQAVWYGAGAPTADASRLARRLVVGILVAVLLPIAILIIVAIGMSAETDSDDTTGLSDSTIDSEHGELGRTCGNQVTNDATALCGDVTV